MAADWRLMDDPSAKNDMIGFRSERPFYMPGCCPMYFSICFMQETEKK